MRRLLSSVIVSSILGAPGPAAAQKLPVGPTFQVNTFTLGNQGGTTDCRYNYNEWGGQQTVGSDAAGNFVVVWRSDDQDGSYTGLFAQRFDSTGTRVGGEFVVSETTLGPQTNPAIAMDAAGNFVVAWNDGGSYGTGGAYFNAGYPPVRLSARRFDSTGAPAGGEFQVSSDTYPYDTYVGAPALALDGAGNFIVVWTQIDGFGGDMNIVGRRYDSAGTPLGGEFQVSDPGPYYSTSNSFPSVAAKPDGSFVVAWEATAEYFAILARRYDSAGTPQGGQFTVNELETYTFDEAANVASLAGGGFVVAWVDTQSDDRNYNIAARFLDSTGVPVGAEFVVNTTTEGGQYCPAVAAGGDGGFVVTWDDFSNIGYSYAQARGQQFSGSGAPVGRRLRPALRRPRPVPLRAEDHLPRGDREPPRPPPLQGGDESEAEPAHVALGEGRGDRDRGLRQPLHRHGLRALRLRRVGRRAAGAGRWSPRRTARAARPRAGGISAARARRSSTSTPQPSRAAGRIRTACAASGSGPGRPGRHRYWSRGGV